MREIKFRGMGYDNRWHYGFLIIRTQPESDPMGQPMLDIDGEHIFKDHCYIYNEDDDRELEDNFIEVFTDSDGQYTGLKDKNGKEIYEGDIIRNHINGRIEYVAWHESTCGWGSAYKKGNGLCHLAFVAGFAEKYEIIGNIYENPELLESDE